MCVLALAWAAHPRWRLVAIGNRDELHTRPAAPLARWDDPAGVIAGRDLVSGGTWMGVSTGGRFAVVTNLRGFGEPDPAKLSRGALVRDWLAAGRITPGAYNPFSLVTADARAARFMTNLPAPAEQVLAPGVYGLANAGLDAPWPKTLRLKAALTAWLATDTAPAALLDALGDETMPGPADEQTLRAAETSPVFIRHPVYGTRCSTVVALGADGRGTIIERRFAPDGAITGESAIDVC